MFSLFFVASLVLPSVLGNCCFPDMYSAIIYDPALPGTADLLVDWTVDKYAIVPEGGDLKSVLFDVPAKLKYLRYADGSCETKTAEPYTQCLAKSLTAIGHNTLGGSLGVNTFGRKGSADMDYITLTDDCLPVISVSIATAATHTKIFVNATITSTTFSELSADVSDCKMAEV